MATIVVLHYKHMKEKLAKPFSPYAMRIPSEKVSISLFMERKSRKRDCSVKL